MRVSFVFAMLASACGASRTVAPEPAVAPALNALPAPLPAASASALSMTPASSPTLSAAPKEGPTLFQRLPDRPLALRTQNGSTRVLAKNANWAAVAPDGVHVLVAAEGAARLLPEGRALPVSKVNEHSAFAPDGKTLLVAIDDLHPANGRWLYWVDVP